MGLRVVFGGLRGITRYLRGFQRDPGGLRGVAGGLSGFQGSPGFKVIPRRPHGRFRGFQGTPGCFKSGSGGLRDLRGI